MSGNGGLTPISWHLFWEMNENDGNPWSNLGKEITLVDENPKAQRLIMKIQPWSPWRLWIYLLIYVDVIILMYVDIRMLIYASVCSYHRSYQAPPMQIRSTNTLSTGQPSLPSRASGSGEGWKASGCDNCRRQNRMVPEMCAVWSKTWSFTLTLDSSFAGAQKQLQLQHLRPLLKDEIKQKRRGIVIMIMIQKVTENKPIGCRRLCPVFNGQHGRSSPWRATVPKFILSVLPFRESSLHLEGPRDENEHMETTWHMHFCIS